MDIHTLSDLLREFVAVETDFLNKQNIKHPTTIGNMYEGLTEEVLNRSVFTGLNLKVVKNSFIAGCTTEFDVLLVVAEGQKIPYANQYIFAPEQVIAIVSVKKTLHLKELSDGFSNLNSAIECLGNMKVEPYTQRLFRDSFRSIAQKDITAKVAGTLSPEEDLLYSTLRVEAFLPVRMIWGYNGFANELNFRNAFRDFFSQNLPTEKAEKRFGFAPQFFPSLIVSGQYSLVKINGLPFGPPPTSSKWWEFFGSSSYNATYFFLEAIWTRLTYMFENIPSDIFGDDLTVEPLNRLIACKATYEDGLRGWMYRAYDFSQEHLKDATGTQDWKPVELDDPQHVVLMRLTADDEIDLQTEKESLEEFVKTYDYPSLDDFLKKLVATGLVYIEGDKLQFLTDNCQCIILPDGRVVAAENKSGRLMNWLRKEVLTKENN